MFFIHKNWKKKKTDFTEIMFSKLICVYVVHKHKGKNSKSSTVITNCINKWLCETDISYPYQYAQLQMQNTRKLLTCTHV